MSYILILDFIKFTNIFQIHSDEVLSEHLVDVRRSVRITEKTAFRLLYQQLDFQYIDSVVHFHLKKRLYIVQVHNSTLNGIPLVASLICSQLFSVE